MPKNDLLRELLVYETNEGKYSEKQLKILAAAIEIFSEKGYAASSTSEIAKKAGVAEGTIFRHYKTKKELLVSIVTPLLAKIVGPAVIKDFTKEVFEADHESFEGFIRMLAYNRYEFVKKHRVIIKILIQEIPFHEEVKSLFLEMFKGYIYEKFVVKINYFQERGDIAPMPPETVIRLIVTTLLGLMLSMFIFLPNKSWDYQQEIEASIISLVKGLKP